MKKIIVYITGILLFLNACGSVPLTGRRQVLLVSDQDVLSASLTQYNDYIKTADLSHNQADINKVVRVGKRIAAATEEYMNTHGLASEVKNFAWEFNLVDENTVNAFCMPGGKIVVYEGLLKLTSTDDELAVVMGHEVAHAVAKHSNERMSQQVLSQVGASVLSEAVRGHSGIVQAAAGTIYGLGSQYGVMLPYSRKHELEADHLGLIFMAMAGYNPDAAVTFWQKMAAQGGSSPEILSTHPSDANRIREIQKYLPEARSYVPKP